MRTKVEEFELQLANSFHNWPIIREKKYLKLKKFKNAFHFKCLTRLHDDCFDTKLKAAASNTTKV
jgi:hypothetical protein